ncbi:hypothetical protein Tco_0965972 [Tanacetum coccineum]
MATHRGFVHLEELRLLANSTKLRDQLLVSFDMKTQRESQIATEFNNLTRQLVESIDERLRFDRKRDAFSIENTFVDLPSRQHPIVTIPLRPDFAGVTDGTKAKIVRIPLPNGEILEVQSERPEKDPGSLACIKADERKLDDIRVVRDFPEVFLDDLLGLPLMQEIEFRIDLIPGTSPVVRSLYRLAPLEMLELSNQLKELQEKGFIRPSYSPWGAPPCSLSKEKTSSSMRMCGQSDSIWASRTKDLNIAPKGGGRATQDLRVSEIHNTNHRARQRVANASSRKEKTQAQDRVRARVYYYQSGLKTKIWKHRAKLPIDLKAPAECLRGLERDTLSTEMMIFIHPGADKMYYDSEILVLWPWEGLEIRDILSRDIPSKVVLETMTIYFEVWPGVLGKFNGAIRENLNNGKWS